MKNTIQEYEQFLIYWPKFWEKKKVELEWQLLVKDAEKLAEKYSIDLEMALYFILCKP